MAIKTSDLQAAAAPKATDTLLLADSASGTSQLTLAQAAAWFGAELVKAGNPVGTALSSKAAKSAQDTVEGRTVPARTVTVDAADLPTYIASLPRLLTEDLSISAKGTLTEPLNIKSFYGPGSILINGGAAGGLLIQGAVAVESSSVQIEFRYTTFQESAATQTTRDFVIVTNCRNVAFNNCEFAGNGDLTALCAYSSDVRVLYTGIHGFETGVLALQNGIISISYGTGMDFSANAYGIQVWHGGIVLLDTNVPDLLGGSSNAKKGGLIVKANGTLL